MDINARLEKLERENRRMKKVGIVTVVFASVLFISGQAKTNKVVQANEFQVVDASGKVRAILSSLAGAGLILYDEAGTAVVDLSATSGWEGLLLGDFGKRGSVSLRAGTRNLPDASLSLGTDPESIHLTSGIF